MTSIDMSLEEQLTSLNSKTGSRRLNDSVHVLRLGKKMSQKRMGQKKWAKKMVFVCVFKLHTIIIFPCMAGLSEAIRIILVLIKVYKDYYLAPCIYTQLRPASRPS